MHRQSKKTKTTTANMWKRFKRKKKKEEYACRLGNPVKTKIIRENAKIQKKKKG